MVLKLFRLPETKEVWIHILGFIIALLGAYYIVGGLYHLTAFAWATVFGRLAVLLFLIVITLRKTTPTIILFGVVDTARAVWRSWRFGRLPAPDGQRGTVIARGGRASASMGLTGTVTVISTFRNR